eukprot:GHVS01015568.1.p1 GENE.GHVS01015568.1~~GHVS01015568.1.p1  ORF type:complete len:138 (+),score=5.05 GHVS01015568.1:49-414(+)
MRLPRQVFFEVAKGFRGRSKGCIKLCRIRVIKALTYSFFMRRQRARRYRCFWVTRISAATREWGLPYSWFIGSLYKINIALDRKVLANLALTEPISFKALVDEAKRVKFTPPSKVRDISQL